MNKTKLKEVTEWSGKHRGVTYEIKRWWLADRETWNYYILLQKGQIPKNEEKHFNLKGKREDFLGTGCKHLRYNYEEETPDLDWHGGITYYEKVLESDSALIGFRLGCDYAHYFGTSERYTLQDVQEDAINSIDKLFELIPNLKVPCSWDGAFYLESEGTLNEDGSFTSYKGQEKTKESHNRISKMIGEISKVREGENK